MKTLPSGKAEQGHNILAALHLREIQSSSTSEVQRQVKPPIGPNVRLRLWQSGWPLWW